MRIELPTTVTVTLNDDDLGAALLRRAVEMCGNPDDAGCDWYTDDHGNTYIGASWEWQVSSDPTVAAMVDLYHVLTGSKPGEYKMRAAA